MPKNYQIKKISGWGGYPSQKSEVITPTSLSSFKDLIKEKKNLIARGMGRSYGDSANGDIVFQTNCLDNFISFDFKSGIISVESGVTLREILKIIVKYGWFLPVSPGTSYVSVGGAIASDVHGKNHHHVGSFGQHVLSIKILLGTGEIVTTSPNEMQDLFYATCGGMGLTGIILSAKIKLIPIKSSLIKQKSIKLYSLSKLCEALEEYNKFPYCVAWIDCLAKDSKDLRSILTIGEHCDDKYLDLKIKNPFSIPFYTPVSLLNDFSLRVLNSSYWLKTKNNEIKLVSLMKYFYPLDKLSGWNKLYGRAGMIQYQFVVPKINGINNLNKIVNKILSSRNTSFLGVLKLFGEANKNLLSFPIEGYTLTLDFKMSASTIKLLNELDEIVSEVGGKINLCKDSVMKELIFKKTYTRWRDFQSVREKYGAIEKFSSAQSKRLGL